LGNPQIIVVIFLLNAKQTVSFSPGMPISLQIGEPTVAAQMASKLIFQKRKILIHHTPHQEPQFDHHGLYKVPTPNPVDTLGNPQIIVVIFLLNAKQTVSFSPGMPISLQIGEPTVAAQMASKLIFQKRKILIHHTPHQEPQFDHHGLYKVPTHPLLDK
jgi:acyl CoA:acetate/3-ketoacid CoA transferase beta subunit